MLVDVRMCLGMRLHGPGGCAPGQSRSAEPLRQGHRGSAVTGGRLFNYKTWTRLNIKTTAVPQRSLAESSGKGRAPAGKTQGRALSPHLDGAYGPSAAHVPSLSPLTPVSGVFGGL